LPSLHFRPIDRTQRLLALIAENVAADAYYSDGRRFIILVRRKTQRLFEVPIALITFIDRDHQWFKSQVGLPEEIAEAH
jgi:hypothetical protein